MKKQKSLNESGWIGASPYKKSLFDNGLLENNYIAKKLAATLYLYVLNWKTKTNWADGLEEAEKLS